MVNMYKVNVIEHPLIQERLTVLRHHITPAPEFRRLLTEIGELMLYEILREISTETITVQTPLEKTTGLRLKNTIHLITILRAGIAMTEGMARLLPEAHIGHLGIYRNEQTLQPVVYYSKLPTFAPQDWVILVDPMLATGGSVAVGLGILRKAGASNLFIATLIAAPEGLAMVRKNFPEVPIYTTAVDRQLNDKGYILPGLGDAGDRQFNT
jgi:uracil phosphoribosyltransferase